VISGVRPYGNELSLLLHDPAPPIMQDGGMGRTLSGGVPLAWIDPTADELAARIRGAIEAFGRRSDRNAEAAGPRAAGETIAFAANPRRVVATPRRAYTLLGSPGWAWLLLAVLVSQVAVRLWAPEKRYESAAAAPPIVLDGEAIDFDRRGPVPWSAIRRICVTDRAVSIELLDEQDAVQQPWFTRAHFEHDECGSYVRLSVALDRLDASAAEIAAALRPFTEMWVAPGL
jgi:hypothetical protein